jgi:hypothetical protein
MVARPEDLPEDIDALRVALLAERARAARVEAELAVARAKASDDAAVIAHQRLQIEKLTRQLYGPRSERTVRLLDQMELGSRNSRVRPARTRLPPSGPWRRPPMS